MSCETCKNGASNDMLGDITKVYDRQNKRLWIVIIGMGLALVIMAACMIWTVLNVQRIANEAMTEALYTVAEIGVTTEETTTTTTTTQTVEGDSATINNVDGEQYNDSATNEGAGS